jgi:hypothetical protein
LDESGGLMDDATPDQRFDDQLAAMVKARDELAALH